MSASVIHSHSEQDFKLEAENRYPAIEKLSDLLEGKLVMIDGEQNRLYNHRTDPFQDDDLLVNPTGAVSEIEAQMMYYAADEAGYTNL